MKEKYLVDTDILIDYLKNYSKAQLFLEKTIGIWFISTITVAELYAGVRDNNEQIKIEYFLSAFQIIPVTKEIAQKGGLIKKEFGKIFGIGLADAIIAASAILKEAKLVTLNLKHYKMIENVFVPYQK